MNAFKIYLFISPIMQFKKIIKIMDKLKRGTR